MAGYIGQQLGNYRLTRLLGEGGFAEVYLGEHVRLGMKAAVKVLRTHLAEGEINAFQQEAQIIADLKHPHIIRVLDFDVQAGTPFLVLDYAPNGSLRQKHPKGIRLPLSLVVDYITQLTSALQYAHDHKLIHRDIKPENMLIGERGEILLSDFGIATIAHATSSMNTQTSMGTLAYMPPEQIQGKPRKESDQYALAVTVYQWLTGELPFQGSSTEMIAQHLAIPAPSLHASAPDLPVQLDQALQKALAKDPKERYGQIQDFAHACADALKTLQQHMPLPANPGAPAALPGNMVSSGYRMPPVGPQALPPTEVARVEESMMPQTPYAPIPQTEFASPYPITPIAPPPPNVYVPPTMLASAFPSSYSITAEPMGQRPLPGKRRPVSRRLLIGGLVGVILAGGGIYALARSVDHRSSNNSVSSSAGGRRPTPPSTSSLVGTTWTGYFHRYSDDKVFSLITEFTRVEDDAVSVTLTWPTDQNTRVACSGSIIKNNDFGDSTEQQRWSYVDGYGSNAQGTWVKFREDKILAGDPEYVLGGWFYVFIRNDKTMKGAYFSASQVVASANIQLSQ